ncbi:MAG: hypothetical protein OXT65_12765 [Alphaproteobacteria bacterium]|nr:hypothetical protein [Alphaproteobacteria bacterium]
MVAGLMFQAAPAFAQAIEGCNPAVFAAMQSTGNAHVAASVSADDVVFEQDDSVLALTCFNQAAAISAYHGAQIWSGDFMPTLRSVIEDALVSHYDDFPYSTGTVLGNRVNYGATTLPAGSAAFACDEILNLWQAAEVRGNDMGVPHPSFSELVAGGAPGAGNVPTVGGAAADPDYAANWNAAADQGVFSSLQTSYSALPQPAVTPVSVGQPSSPPNPNVQTPCLVLLQLGAVAACP